ncbi:hypothetical protein [Mycolicibacterium chubuense]|uniref:hypothetical protein n=1 Tax=Mycolicibacterium chubuense TaxID=1800 RepID=UPI0013017F08|nr:hypothetical protein [Mycolicibacterium chubuense]
MTYQENDNLGHIDAPTTHVAHVAAQPDDGLVALLLQVPGINVVWKGDPTTARQLAAALLNEADKVSGQL